MSHLLRSNVVNFAVTDVGLIHKYYVAIFGGTDAHTNVGLDLPTSTAGLSGYKPQLL